MADRRRRRPSEGESEEETGELQRKERPSECESEGEHVEGEQDLSEYESANEEHGDGKNGEEDGGEEEEEDEEGSEEEETDDEEEETDEDEEDDDETETYDGDSIVIDEYEGLEEERQSGDGEEQPAQDVDDDEDRKNPAFVPRRGAFYEHDMRIHEEGEGEEGDDKRPKKKLWKDDGKWIHDRYREDQQGPKSREELMAIYGYDILQYDKPPDAPQRNNSSRSRGRRSDQRSTLRDFVHDRQNRPPSRRSPQSDFVERKNSYNNENERRRNYYDKEQNYNSQNDYMANRSSSLEPDDQRYNANQERSYSRTPDRNFPSNRGPNRPDTDRNYDRQDYRNYNTQDRSYDNRQRNNYNTRGRGNRGGGRFEGRGSRRGRGGDERGRGGDERSRGGDDRTKRNYTDLRDKNSRGRKYPPRFQQKQDYERRYDNSEYYDDFDDYEMPTTVVIDTSIPEPVTPPASPPPEQKSPPQQNYSKSANIPSDNSQSAASTGPSERKSYAKDRRGRTSGRLPDIDAESQDLAAAEQGLKHLSIQGSPQTADQESKTQSASPKSRSSPSPKQSYDSNQQRNYKSRGNTKQQDLSQQGRPKRYSSQRQRNVPDVPYTENVPQQPQVFNKPASVPQDNPAFYKRTYIEPEGPTTPTFRPALIQPGAMAFPIPVSSGAMPNQPPPVFRPPHSNVAPVTLSTQVPIMPPPQYINTGMIYPAPPPPFPVQATPIPIPAYPTPQSVNTQQQPPQQNTQNPRQDFYRGGTTYYAPELQYKKPHTSPVRRLKSAIPIVDPQEVKREKNSPEDMSQNSRLQSNMDAGMLSDGSPSASPDVQMDNIKSEPFEVPSQEVVETDQSVEVPDDKNSISFVKSSGDYVSVDKDVPPDYEADQSKLQSVENRTVKTDIVENVAISNSSQPSGDMEDDKVSQNVIEATT